MKQNERVYLCIIITTLLSIAAYVQIASELAKRQILLEKRQVILDDFENRLQILERKP